MTVRERVESTPSTVLRTPFLARYYLRFNILGSFIICVECDPIRGVPYDQIYTHMKSHKELVPLLKKLREKKWLITFVDDIKRALCLKEHPTPMCSQLATPELTKEEWRGSARPADGSYEPFEGIPTHEGVVCLVPPCKEMTYPYCAENYNSLRQHIHGAHTDNERQAIKPTSRYREATIQTIFRGNGKCWFPVNSPSKPFVAMTSHLDDNEGANGPSLVDLFKAEASSMLGSTAMIPSNKSVLLHPVFHDTLMVTLWDVLDLSNVRELHRMAPVPFQKASKKLKQLQLGVSASFFSIAESAQRAHVGILYLVTNGTA